MSQDIHLSGKRKLRPRKRISRDRLIDLYVTQKLTIHQIGKEVGVTGTSVLRWLKSYQIQVRKPAPDPSEESLRMAYSIEGLSYRAIAVRFGLGRNRALSLLAKYGIERHPTVNSLADKGIAAPTKECLENLIHTQHKDYAEIGHLLGGITKEAVKIWVRKLGVKPPHRWNARKHGRVQFPIPELVKRLHINEHKTLAEIGKMFGFSGSAIARFCDKHSITKRPMGARRGLSYETRNGTFVRSSYELKVSNWLTDNEIEHEYDPLLPFGRHRADFKVGDIYIEIWGITSSIVYDIAKQKKREQYKLHRMSLIELSPKHFINSAWIRILTQALRAGGNGSKKP